MNFEKDVKREWYVTIMIPVFTLILIIIAVGVARKVNDAQIVNVALVAGLVGVTTWYSYSTAKMASEIRMQAEAAKQQAEATLKMARHMAKPRLMPDLYLDGWFLEGRRVSFHVSVANDGEGPAFDVEMSIEDNSFPPSPLLKGRYPISVLRKGDDMGWPSPLPHHLDFPDSDQELRMFLVIRYRDIDGEHQVRLPFVLTTENNKPYARQESIYRKTLRKIDLENELP